MCVRSRGAVWYSVAPMTYAALIMAVLGWGSSFVATKIALVTLSAGVILFVRHAVAAVILFVIFKRRRLEFPSRRLWPKLLLMGLFEPILYFLLETEGLRHTSASSASLVIAAVPVLVAVAAWPILKEKPTARSGIGAVLSVAGVVLLVLGDNNPDYAESSLLGNLLVLGAAVSAVGYILISRSLSGRVHPVTITFLQMIVGAAFFLFPAGASTAFDGLPVFTVESVLALTALTIFATVLAFFGYNYALSKIPAAKASVFINGIPLVTVLAAALFLGESLTLLQAGAGVVIVAGVVLAGKRRKQRAASPS